MKALIAFIGMAVLILVLIEINERIKAKRKQQSEQPDLQAQREQDDCPQEKTEQKDCSACALIDVCEKK